MATKPYDQKLHDKYDGPGRQAVKKFLSKKGIKAEDNEDKFLSPLYSNVAISKLHLFTNPHGIELAVDRALAALKACASCDVVLENISQQLASSICATLHLMTTLFRLREPLELY